MKPLRIAVSGIGGASGQSALKALQMMDDPPEIFPVDVTPYSAGLYFPGTRSATVLPPPERNIEAWIQFVRQNSIDAIIPGADRDLMPLALHAAETKALVSSPEVIAIADDKYKTALWLRTEAGVEVPEFCLPESAHNWKDFPCVVKPRCDAASRGFHICADEEELHFYLNRTQKPIIQEYINADEYTANIFTDSDGEPRASLVMLRKERGGIAIQAQPVRDAEIDEMLRKIACKLKPRGTLSVQLRKVLDLPLPFEINARISGSTIVRALAGYNDAEMLINHFVLGKPVVQPEIDYSKHYFRYYDVIAVDSHEIADFYGMRPEWH